MPRGIYKEDCRAGLDCEGKMRDFLDSDMKVLIGFLGALVLIGVTGRGCQRDIEGQRFKRDADLRTLCIQSGGTVVENSCVRCK